MLIVLSLVTAGYSSAPTIDASQERLVETVTVIFIESDYKREIVRITVNIVGN
jgi:hypothetical protein